MEHLRDAGFGEFKISVVVTRHNVDQLDEFKALADTYRRPTPDHPAAPFGSRRRLVARPPPHAGAAAPDLRLAARARRQRAHRRFVLPPQRSRRGEPLPGLNMCGAGRVVCLIDPIGDVYACPFVHPRRVQGRLGSRRRRLQLRLEAQRPLHRTPRAPIGRSVRVLRELRRVSGRLHGCKVLRRHSTRRSRPRVRRRLRRGSDARRLGRRCHTAEADDGPLETGPRSRHDHTR